MVVFQGTLFGSAGSGAVCCAPANTAKKRKLLKIFMFDPSLRNLDNAVVRRHHLPFRISHH